MSKLRDDDYLEMIDLSIADAAKDLKKCPCATCGAYLDALLDFKDYIIQMQEENE